MKLRALISVGILAAMAAAASAQVRVTVKDGRHLISNDGPANIRASEEWLAARVGRASAYDDLIAAAARDNSVDPKLVKSVMLIESGFNPAAISRKGARGLMQLMPAVAAEHGVRDVHDPKQNITAGTEQLSRLMSYYAGDLVKALAAYNAGEGAVDKYDGVPPYAETQLYVRKALAAHLPVDAYTTGRDYGADVLARRQVLLAAFTAVDAASSAVYVVRAGDTLTSIAVRLHVTVARLIALNHLVNADRITVGQPLVVAGPATTRLRLI
jgi:LysM repeat protein